MQRIGFIVLPGFQMMSVAVLSVFEFANMEMGEPIYDVHLLSETGGSIRSSIGISVATEPFDDTNFDTLLVGGSAVVGSLTPGVIRFLRQAVGRSRRVASTCVGAFVLAEAGLLDGRRATTHWHRARELQARFPKVKVEEDRIFIIDGPVWTSAGMTAGIDLALAMVEQDLGAEVARAVALPPAYGSSRHRFAGRGLQGGEEWTRTLGRAWTRRSAASTLAEAGPRPSADGGCRPGASRTPC